MQSNNVLGNSRTRKTISSKLFLLLALLPLNSNVMWSIITKIFPLTKDNEIPRMGILVRIMILQNEQPFR